MKEENNRVLIIIPAYNEEHNLEKVMKGLRAYDVFSFADILIIDDASGDGTAEIALRNQARCIRFPYNLGYGNALQTGYKYARRHGYPYVIQMDADGQHDPCNIERIYRTLCSAEDDADIVLAGRFLEGSSPYKTGLVMKLAFWWFRTLIRCMGGLHVMDSTTGLQGLKRRAFSCYAGFDHFDSDYPDSNMILQMALLGFKIKQIPAVMHHRESGKGMHAGLLRPARYMFRSTTAVFAVWLRSLAKTEA